MLKDERDLHKSLLERRDGLDALFATSTVAQGMNLPSDIVLIAGDSRWDDSKDKMQQLDAHELLNAAGRAGRAGESGQGFVLIVPSKVIDLDDGANKIDHHWMSLQGISQLWITLWKAGGAAGSKRRGQLRWKMPPPSGAGRCWNWAAKYHDPMARSSIW